MQPRPFVTKQPVGDLLQEYRAAGKLEGRTALIKGVDSGICLFSSLQSANFVGIGRSVAVMFAKEGADVAIVYLPMEEADAQETKTMVERENRRCLLIVRISSVLVGFIRLI